MKMSKSKLKVRKVPMGNLSEVSIILQSLVAKWTLKVSENLPCWTLNKIIYISSHLLNSTRSLRKCCLKLKSTQSVSCMEWSVPVASMHFNLARLDPDKHSNTVSNDHPSQIFKIFRKYTWIYK